MSCTIKSGFPAVNADSRLGTRGGRPCPRGRWGNRQWRVETLGVKLCDVFAIEQKDHEKQKKDKIGDRVRVTCWTRHGY